MKKDRTIKFRPWHVLTHFIGLICASKQHNRKKIKLRVIASAILIWMVLSVVGFKKYHHIDFRSPTNLGYSAKVFSMHMIDPIGFHHGHWPLNGSVKNLSTSDVFVLINGHYQVLKSKERTLSNFAHWEDVDGVWCKGKFYSLNMGENLIIDSFGDIQNIKKKPWNQTSVDGSPESRGAENNSCPLHLSDLSN